MTKPEPKQGCVECGTEDTGRFSEDADRCADCVLESILKRAREAGCDAARAAASWTVEAGRCDPVAIAQTLKGLEDGDPVAYDSLPPAPDLSGEWADSPTPRSLAADLGADPEDAELVEAIADAFEDGVLETFEAVCVAELRKYV